MGAGAEPAATPKRSDSEPGGNGEGLRLARIAGVRRHPGVAGQTGRRGDAGRPDRRREPAERGAWPPAVDRGELSAVEGQRAVQSADGRAERNGKSPGSRADALQRARAGIQHQPPPVSRRADRELVPFQGLPAFRSAAGGATGTEGKLSEVVNADGSLFTTSVAASRFPSARVEDRASA